jgi:Ca2+-binding RTX toxin-like protein
MRRIVLLTALAAMMAAAMALSGVAQAKPITNTKADKACLVEAVRTVEQPGFNPSNYTFHGGTEGNDIFTGQATAGNDVFCGFGGADRIETLDAGDIFLGGASDDFVRENFGTFNGGEGNDIVVVNIGTFNGGEGTDFVQLNGVGGTFNGGAGDDIVQNNVGIFNQD